jgi:hypothetical protein
MGLSVSVYRWGLGDCTNGGKSAGVGSLCVVNVPGPFNPRPELPAFELVEGPGGRGHAILRPVEAKKPGMVGPMSGGNYAAIQSDARFSEAIQKLTGCQALRGRVRYFDRYETPAEYEALSR